MQRILKMFNGSTQTKGFLKVLMWIRKNVHKTFIGSKNFHDIQKNVHELKKYCHRMEIMFTSSKTHSLIELFTSSKTFFHVVSKNVNEFKES